MYVAIVKDNGFAPSNEVSPDGKAVYVMPSREARELVGYVANQPVDVRVASTLRMLAAAFIEQCDYVLSCAPEQRLNISVAKQSAKLACDFAVKAAINDTHKD
ncbi:MAG: hypothetical protein WC790_00490 [Candidatus Paceibacterota bacterium]|jgi:hypothetical protein